VAATIAQQLHTPDILALQEVENARGFARNDHVLADLSKELQQLTGVKYDFVLSHGISDRRNISQAFLYRTDRVSVQRGATDDPLLGTRPDDKEVFNQAVRNPKSLNKTVNGEIQKDRLGKRLFSRPVLAAKFRVHRDGVDSQGPSEDVYVLNNHFKSNPSKYSRRRAAMAAFNAKLVAELKTADPNANVIVAGDLNADYNTNAHKKQIGALESMTASDKKNAHSARESDGEALAKRSLHLPSSKS
jgi:predicted extracellular nuclease